MLSGLTRVISWLCIFITDLNRSQWNIGCERVTYILEVLVFELKAVKLLYFFLNETIPSTWRTRFTNKWRQRISWLPFSLLKQKDALEIKSNGKWFTVDEQLIIKILQRHGQIQNDGEPNVDMHTSRRVHARKKILWTASILQRYSGTVQKVCR